MYVLKNALISIVRNKGRNILIGAIILVVACACTVTLAINNTASDLISSYESGYAKELTFGFDRQSMMKGFDFGGSQGREGAQEKFSKIASYTVEDVENFAESVGNSLLESEIASSNKQEEEIAGNFGGGFRGMQEQGGAKGEMNLAQKPAVQAYDSMNAVVDAGVIVELLMIGTMLVLVGSLAAMISIQRFSPLTILKERS